MLPMLQRGKIQEREKPVTSPPTPHDFHGDTAGRKAVLDAEMGNNNKKMLGKIKVWMSVKDSVWALQPVTAAPVQQAVAGTALLCPPHAHRSELT